MGNRQNYTNEQHLYHFSLDRFSLNAEFLLSEVNQGRSGEWEAFEYGHMRKQEYSKGSQLATVRTRVSLAALREEYMIREPIELIENLVESKTAMRILEYLSLGMVKEGAISEFIKEGSPNFRKVLYFLLGPFFSEKPRFLKIGDYFRYGDSKFKVLGAFPASGIVTEATVISCSELIFDFPLTTLSLSPLKAQLSYPTSLHIHDTYLQTDEIVEVGSSKYIVTGCYPSNGKVTASTELTISPEAIPVIEKLKLVPYTEDLPIQLQMMPRDTMIDDVFSLFITPYFQGRKRYVQTGQVFIIFGVCFKATECTPKEGVTSKNTVFVYEGTALRRDLEEISNLVGASIEISDPFMLQAAQHFQLQQIINYGNELCPGTDEITIHSLPTHSVDDLPSDTDNYKCMVCMTALQPGDTVRTLPCFHIYHTDCVDNWLLRSTLCPICKHPVDMS